jgi:bifunctional DNase/RNase
MLVEMSVESLRVHTLTGQYVLILKQQEKELYLPIWIGQWEAFAIHMKLSDMKTERPMTHDLLLSTLEHMGGQLSKVVVTALNENTFHANLIVHIDGKELEVDARPSDAIALALRAEAPIFADQEVLDRSGVLPKDEEEEEKPGIFKDWINQLDIGEFGAEGKPPPEERGL